VSKKMKVLVAVIIAVLLLTVGFAATALAQEEKEPTPPQPGGAVWERVAEILGISQDELTSAFNQARNELMQSWQQQIRQRWQERCEERLTEAVNEGLITEEEAAQIREWWAQRPEALNKLAPLGPGGKPSKIKGMMGKWQGRGGMGGWRGQAPNQPAQ
jgi:hypothetical protein